MPELLALHKALSERIEETPDLHRLCAPEQHPPYGFHHYPDEPPHCAEDRQRWPCDQEVWRQSLEVVEWAIDTKVPNA